MKICELKDYHAGRPVAVLGGGPSLPADFGRLPPGCILVMVNYHAARIVALEEIDFMVFNDRPHDIAEFQACFAGMAGRRVSIQRDLSDFDLFGSGYWDGGFSSTVAVWLACYLGGDPVLLCGMDCYRGDRPYFYENARWPRHYCQDYPIENHLKAWAPALRFCPNGERIRAVSGPLVEVFGEYAHDEGGFETRPYGDEAGTRVLDR